MALYGIYGKHTPERCPWLNEEIGKMVMEYPDDIVEKMGKKYKINKIVGQYHSACKTTTTIFSHGSFMTEWTF